MKFFTSSTPSSLFHCFKTLKVYRFLKFKVLLFGDECCVSIVKISKSSISRFFHAYLSSYHARREGLWKVTFHLSHQTSIPNTSPSSVWVENLISFRSGRVQVLVKACNLTWNPSKKWEFPNELYIYPYKSHNILHALIAISPLLSIIV